MFQILNKNILNVVRKKGGKFWDAKALQMNERLCSMRLEVKTIGSGKSFVAENI